MNPNPNKETPEQELRSGIIRLLKAATAKDAREPLAYVADFESLFATHYKAREAEIRIDELEMALENSNQGSHGVSKFYIRRRLNQWRSVKTARTVEDRLSKDSPS